MSDASTDQAKGAHQIAEQFEEELRLLDEMEHAGLRADLDQSARDLCRLIQEHAHDYKGTEYGDMTLSLMRALHSLVMAVPPSNSTCR